MRLHFWGIYYRPKASNGVYWQIFFLSKKGFHNMKTSCRESKCILSWIFVCLFVFWNNQIKVTGLIWTKILVFSQIFSRYVPKVLSFDNNLHTVKMPTDLLYAFFLQLNLKYFRRGSLGNENIIFPYWKAISFEVAEIQSSCSPGTHEREKKIGKTKANKRHYRLWST